LKGIVIGAGLDELVVARALARAGLEVLVLEERAARLEHVGWLPPDLLEGVTVEPPDPWLAVALPDGGALELSRDMARTVAAIRRLSPGDAARWPQFSERMARLARLLQSIYLAPPPRLVDLSFALKVRRLGRQGMEDLMRLLPMPVAEWLDDWFECDALKGALATLAIAHLQQGPRSAGTAFRLLHAHVGNPPGVFRAGRSNAAEVLRAGLNIRRANVKAIVLQAGAAQGVVLEGGEEIRAGLVVSGSDPRRTLVDLVAPGWLDPELGRGLRHIRRRGVVAKLKAVPERSPRFASLAIAPSLDYLERAYDHVKYGRVSEQPYVEMRADGEIHFQFAPYAARDAHAVIAARARDVLSPHVGPLAVQEVATPADLEATQGWPEGQHDQAELTLDQALWMRPVPELAHYETPIPGLWLCGPAMHPGMAGLVGRNCAQRIVSKLER